MPEPAAAGMMSLLARTVVRRADQRERAAMNQLRLSIQSRSLTAVPSRRDVL